MLRHLDNYKTLALAGSFGPPDFHGSQGKGRARPGARRLPPNSSFRATCNPGENRLGVLVPSDVAVGRHLDAGPGTGLNRVFSVQPYTGW
jgi:hypothetical protein